MIRACVVCSRNFASPASRASVCSDGCRKEKDRQKSRAWGAANPESVRASNKRTQVNRHANGKFQAYQLKRRSSKAGYLDRFLERARMCNPTTDLTREDLLNLFGDCCAVTGVPFSFDRKLGTGFQNPYAPSIDRIDSSIPYQVGNIQIVLTAINFAKNEMTMQHFTQVWKDITRSWAALTAGQY